VLIIRSWPTSADLRCVCDDSCSGEWGKAGTLDAEIGVWLARIADAALVPVLRAGTGLSQQDPNPPDGVVRLVISN
jgi:hypothetical protein